MRAAGTADSGAGTAGGGAATEGVAACCMLHHKLGCSLCSLTRIVYHFDERLDRMTWLTKSSSLVEFERSAFACHRGAKLASSFMQSNLSSRTT